MYSDNVVNDAAGVKPDLSGIPAASPYAQVGARLVERGYAAIAIMPNTKRPGELRAGEWVGKNKWREEYTRRLPTRFEIQSWSASGAGVCIVCGPASRDVVAFDIDTDDPAIRAAILAVLPPCMVIKRGAKGETRFYRGGNINPLVEGGTLSPSWNINGVRVLDLIGPGRQTVLPPTIHPDTQEPYRWIGPDALEDTDAEDLEELPADIIGRINDALAPLGWAPERVYSPLAAGAAPDVDNPWRQLNERALANLPAWAPALNLYRCRRTGTGYEAVATWRRSCTGRLIEKRKLNLKLDPKGITDFGDGPRGYTAIDLVMAAQDCDFDTAFVFLEDRIGLTGQIIPFIDRLTALPERALDYDPETGEVYDPAAAPAPAPKEAPASGPADDADDDTPEPSAHHKAQAEQAERANAAATLHSIRASDLLKQPVPAREWYVQDFIPFREVTIIIGDGGTGKSLLTMQLAAAGAAAELWMNMKVRKGSTIYYSAEDDVPEMHRRLADICRESVIKHEKLQDLHIIPRAGQDAMLSAFDRNGKMTKPALWRELVKQVDAIRPALVIVDTSADVFAGDENKRKEVRSFIGLLKGLALEFGCAVVLLAHPSVNGMTSGTGTSGSTAWSNSARSRLYFERVLTAGGRTGEINESDPDVRRLTSKKVNYGRAGTNFLVRYDHGVFVREDGQAGAPSAADANKAADEIFLNCLRMFESQGRDVSPKSGPNYAPTQFVGLPEAKGLLKIPLRQAMERLLASKVVRFAHEGPDWRKRSWLTTEPEGCSGPVTGDVPDAVGSPLEAAKAFLLDLLADGPRLATEVNAYSAGAMFTDKTLKKAAAALGVKIVQKDRRWTWSLDAPTMAE